MKVVTVKQKGDGITEAVPVPDDFAQTRAPSLPWHC
jgi:hypothetical protein